MDEHATFTSMCYALEMLMFHSYVNLLAMFLGDFSEVHGYRFPKQPGRLASPAGSRPKRHQRRNKATRRIIQSPSFPYSIIKIINILVKIP